MFKFAKISRLKLVRNVVIVLFSIGWIPCIGGSFRVFLKWFYDSHPLQETKYDFLYHMSSTFFTIGYYWFLIVLAFWTFVLTIKLWPIKKNP